MKGEDSMTTATLVKLETAKKEVKKQVREEPVRKTVYVEMTVPRPKVTFTGEDWCAMDIKLAYAAIVRGFREMQRELYRKEYKKK